MPKPRKKKNKRKKLIFFIFITLFIAASFYALYAADRKLRPVMAETARLSVTAKINGAISEAVNDFTEAKGLSSTDFYVKSMTAEGKLESLSVNTVLLNELCGYISKRLSAELITLGDEKIETRLGSLLGISFLAGTGPVFSYYVLPRGEVAVDYDSSFEAAGINQINFVVWLNVSANAEIIRPFQNTEISAERKIALVNTVITGDVPDGYFNITPNKY